MKTLLILIGVVLVMILAFTVILILEHYHELKALNYRIYKFVPNPTPTDTYIHQV